jgi:hypothetical protein
MKTNPIFAAPIRALAFITRHRLTRALALAFTAGAGFHAAAGEPDRKAVTPLPTEDPWRFSLAVPGFMTGVDGDVGINGNISDVSVGFDGILPRIDMIWVTRAEASKGRFGILGELLYLSLSDGVGTDTIVKKVDVRVDQYLADFTVRWRLVESERGYIDLLAGVRYTNLYQAVTLQPNEERIAEVAENFTDEIGARLRERIDERLSEGRFRNAILAAVGERVTTGLSTASAPDREVELPVGAVAAPRLGRLGGLIGRIVLDRARDVIAAARVELRQAVATEAAAIRAAGVVERARLQARAAALRARVEARIADAKENIEKEIKQTLNKNLNQRVARVDDWWDPYVGIRARYNFTSKFYAIGRADIGGFGIGSDLMWHAEAALGYQLTQSIFAELGYRALSFDYDKDGLTYDTITHGAQVTVGINF